MSPRITLLTAVGVVAFTVTIVGTTVLQVPTAIASAAIVRTAPTIQSATITPSMASTIAMEAVPSAGVLETPQLMTVQGRSIYLVRTDQGSVIIDATTGNVLASSAAGGGGDDSGQTS